MDNMRLANIDIFAMSLFISPLNARVVVKIDMVNPIPASEPTPINCFKLVFKGNLAIFSLIIILLKRKIPTGFPITNPTIIPTLIGLLKAFTLAGISIAVLANTKRGSIIKLTH